MFVFFLLRINFCDFQKINQDQYPALIIFSFLLITCKKKQANNYTTVCIPYVKPVIHCIPFCL